VETPHLPPAFVGGPVYESNTIAIDKFMFKPILLLFMSNLFMIFAWYGHLKDFKNAPVFIAIIVSWGIAFLEYCFQVPANRIGINYFTLPQLKVLQEIITMIVFAGFSVWYMKVPVTRNYFLAAMLLAGAAYLIFTEPRR
jgi:uncharacterized protein (DUF486 family)